MIADLLGSSVLTAVMMAATILAPLLVVLTVAIAQSLHSRRRGRVIRTAAMVAPATVLPAVGLALLAPEQQVEIPWMLLGTSLAVDAVARPLLLTAALLYGAALTASAWVKLRHLERRSGALTGFLLTSYVGNIGTYLAADAVTFYLAFALMSFAAAGLVIHYRTREARRATGIYLVMSVLSETAILAALLLTVHTGGAALVDAPAAVAASEVTWLIIALALFGFGVKAGTVPMHIWLPLAHPAAPPAASAVLSGAMVKAGMIGWLRFVPLGDTAEAVDDGALSADQAARLPDELVETIGAGVDGASQAVHSFGVALLVVALVGALAGAVLGVVQDDPKVVLAYSTISQMGFIGCLIAVGMIDPALAPATTGAAVLYAVHHGLAKGALFLGVPVVKHHGRGATRVIVSVGFTVAALAVAGAPLTSGALGKYVSKEAVSGVSVAGIGLEYVLQLVAVGSTVLLMRTALLLISGPRHARGRADGELVGWLALIAAAVAVPWWIGQSWSPVELPEWTASTLWDATWPLLAGLALGAVTWLLTSRRRARAAIRRASQAAPPGDLVVLPEAAASRGRNRGGRLLDAAHDRVGAGRGRTSEAIVAAARAVREGIGHIERRLGAWDASGLAMVLLLGASALLILIAGWSAT